MEDTWNYPVGSAHTERVRAVECAEIVALDVFNRADGQPVTMSMVQRRLGELEAHRPSCLRLAVRASSVTWSRSSTVLRKLTPAICALADVPAFMCSCA